MNGPIEVVTIGGNTPLPVRHNYTVTLTFKANTWEEPADPGLAEQMEVVLRAWSDGRYPFFVEMIQNGLAEVVKNAIHNCCLKRAQEKYGNQLVDKGNGRRYSRAYEEADKEFEAIISVHNAGRLWLDEVPTVKIEKGEVDE